MSGAGTAWDVVVVGGGPAGLSAALWLARYRRRTLVLDTGDPRNRATWAVHGFPGLPDQPPAELRARLRAQALAAGARFIEARAEGADGGKDGFTVRTAAGESYRARRVLLAYGLQDVLPDLPGIEEAYGESVFHCPDCDGPSMVGARVAVYGRDREAASLALYLLTWASSVRLLTDGGAPELERSALEALRGHDVAVSEAKVRALVAPEGRLRRIELEGADAVEAEALFFHLGVHAACDLGARLGCRETESGVIAVDHAQETSVPGVFAAGDLLGPPFLAVSAAASGVRAALAMHRSLLPDSMHV